MSIEDKDLKEITKAGLNRRDLLKQYSPYTAPLVVSMLSPQTAYGHITAQVYSSSATCLLDADRPTGSMGGGMIKHCGIHPGMNAHMIGP